MSTDQSATLSLRGRERFELQTDGPSPSRGVRRRRWRWRSCRPLFAYALLATIVFSLGVCVLRLTRHVYHENPEYVVAKIDTNSNGKLTREQILDQLDVPLGSPFTQVDLAAKRRRLESLSQVRSVSLRRNAPENTLVVRVFERRPVAWIADRETSHKAKCLGGVLVDSDGHAIECATMHVEYLELPVIEFSENVRPESFKPGERIASLELKRALDLLRHLQAPEWAETVSARTIHLTKHYFFDLLTEDELILRFHLRNIPGQLLKLRYALDRSREMGWDPHRINLMVEDNIPVTLKDDYDPAAESPPAESGNLDRDPETRLY